MTGYRYYSKNDPSKETIFSWPSSSLEEAVEKFAKLKDLPKEEFIRIFEVEKL